MTIIFLTISFWAYCNVFYQLHLLKYQQGYLISSIIQWLLVFIALTWIWGWLISVITTLVLVLGGAIIITNYTTNQIYKYLKITPDVALATFGLSIWILVILLITKIFI